MASMNRQIREEVRVALARRNETQAVLARRIGVTPQYLSDIMRGKSGNVPDVWQKVFDDLGLELVVVKREG